MDEIEIVAMCGGGISGTYPEWVGLPDMIESR